jgi:hypothetical protein
LILKTTRFDTIKKLLSRRLRKRIVFYIQNIRKRYLVFIFFVALSTLAWYIRALADNYITEIKYPVKYSNFPPNRILSKAPPAFLNIQVRADGFTILSYKLKLKRALRFDVNSFSLYSLTKDSTSVYLLTRNIEDKLTTELNETNKNIQILDIYPDTLFFNFSKLRKKKIQVKAAVYTNELMFARQHMLNGEPYTIPDSIIVSGPTSILDTLKLIYTEPLELDNEADTIEGTQHLKTFDKRVIYSLNKVKVVVPIDRFTESEYEIPIDAINVPESLLVKSFPNKIKINYLITLSNFNKVTPGSFHAYIDYNTVYLDINPKLKVELDPLPAYVQNVKIKPAYVEFLIEKRSAENWNYRRNR